MSATFPYQCDWAPSPTMEPSRLKVAFGDGYEQRASAGLNPFLASYDLAFSVRSEAEANAIYAWLQFNNAHVDPFYWDPTWISTTASGEQFGTGDGVRSQWRLSKSGIYVSRDIALNYITREDWQGVVDLSPASRTNYLKQSGSMMTSPWSVGGGMTISGGVADPSGGSQAFTLTQSTGTFGSMYPSSNLSVPSGTYCNSAWVRRRTGKGAVYLWTPNGSGYGTVVGPSASWQRFSNTTASSGTTGYFGITLAALGDAVDVAFGQAEPGTVPGSYIPTTTSVVSVTDYTHTNGLITLGQVPVSGAVLRWGGSGKTHLRWIADKWTPPEPVSYNNWRVQATFRQVP